MRTFEELCKKYEDIEPEDACSECSALAEKYCIKLYKRCKGEMQEYLQFILYIASGDSKHNTETEILALLPAVKA